MLWIYLSVTKSFVQLENQRNETKKIINMLINPYFPQIYFNKSFEKVKENVLRKFQALPRVKEIHPIQTQRQREWKRTTPSLPSPLLFFICFASVNNFASLSLSLSLNGFDQCFKLTAFQLSPTHRLRRPSLFP